MDDYELEQLLRENLKINRENNKILRKLHGHLKWSRFVRIFYWTIIIGSALGIYWFIQPYIDTLRGAYGTFGSFVENPREFISDSLPDIGGGGAEPQ